MRGCFRAEPALGRRHHIRRDLGGLRVRRVRRRRVLASHRRLAGIELARERPRHRRTRTGTARAARCLPCRAPQRPRCPVHVHSLHRASRCGWRRALGRQRGRLVRQRPHRDHQRPLQDRGVAAHGATATMSSTRPSSGATGSTIVGCSNRSATCHLWNSKRRTIDSRARRWQPECNKFVLGHTPGCQSVPDRKPPQSPLCCWLRRIWCLILPVAAERGITPTRSCPAACS